ncbi:ADYC domain-containing protein [Cystobacter fuscus]|uniref:ADYC domain-containing protein n=1 Tax=Cystobacter fuscus TaxID=43 RepID=UPI002B2D4FB5|nr:hypothetical protein F0U63_10140 [Cystobacter fuscus]
MNVSNKPLLSVLSLLLASSALAMGGAVSSSSSAAGSSKAERYARRCQGTKVNMPKELRPQGPLLWGMRSSWADVPPDEHKDVPPDEHKSVLVSVDAASLSKADVGRVLQGRSTEGQGVEVAICGAEDGQEQGMTWYWIEAWNPVAQVWENPCLAIEDKKKPRALAVNGVWDGSGARLEKEGQLTLACEKGVIAKCIDWGYKPWAVEQGQSLASLHQACTRMARADYCGNGTPHTTEGTIIDLYDVMNLKQKTVDASDKWDPKRATFEAAWGPEGAVCLARTRDGRGLEEIQKECPGRFKTGGGKRTRSAVAVMDFQEDRCTLTREGMSLQQALLRNQGY